MALSATIVWEVRTTGSDTNGGGFKTGASGTDWSQQNSAQYSVTDAVTAGTTTITSATANFGTDVVGNVLYISGGTGSITAGWYEITARTNSTTITVDRSTGLTTGTGATLKIGGALASVTQALAASAGSNWIYGKFGNYSFTANPTMNPSGVIPSGSTTATRLIGYNVTRGDQPTGSSRPTITASGTCTTMIPALQGLIVENFILDCNSTANVGIAVGQYGEARNNCVKNFKVNGITLNSGVSSAFRNEVSGGNSGATSGINCSAGNCIRNNYVHDNVCPGIIVSNQGVEMVGNIVASNTGASSDGIQHSYGITIANNVFYGNGRDGIRATGSFPISLHIINNILVNNGASGTGYGINATTSITAQGASWNWDNNAFYNNATGARNGITAGPNDVTLSASPFTNAASGDFSLNSTAGAGAACKAVGYPGVMPGATTTAYTDIGAAQSRGGGIIRTGMDGGF